MTLKSTKTPKTISLRRFQEYQIQLSVVSGATNTLTVAPKQLLKSIRGILIMTESEKKAALLEREAAVILAVTDRVTHGDAAKPSGYWGVVPLESGHELDAQLKALSTEELEGVLNVLTGGVA
jgi:hypothetical protein